MESAKFVIDLIDLIETKRLCGVAIGDSLDLAKNTFGPEEFHKAQLGRRSRL